MYCSELKIQFFYDRNKECSFMVCDYCFEIGPVVRNLLPLFLGQKSIFSCLVREVIMVWGEEGLEQGGLGPQIPSVKLQIEAPPVR